MKVLIGGGTGFIGRHLCRMLTKNGYETAIISRDVGDESQNYISWGDIARYGIPDGLEAVVNLAGRSISTGRSRFEDIRSDLFSSRIDTARLLVESMENSAHPPKVWVSQSAVSYYPVSETADYMEDYVGGDGTILSQLCVELEQASKLSKSSNVRHVTIRIGIALGRDGGAIHRMYIPFFLGLGGRLGSGRQWFPWVHVDDVAGLVLHAVRTPAVSGVLNAVAPHAATNAEFTTAFGKALGRPTALPMPAAALRLALGADRAALLLTGQRVTPRRTLDAGYEFLYPDLASACREFCHILAF